MACEAREELERQLEPVGLLGVERHRDARAGRALGERLDPRQELGEHAALLRHFVARMQRRELDRDARPCLDRSCAVRGAPHRVDRLLVRGEIALGIAGGARRLAEHVVGVAIAERLARRRARDRVVDRLADDELLGHDLHRLADRAADERLAGAADQPPHDRPRVVARVLRPGGERAGEHQPPGRGIEEQPAVLRFPLRAGELVADERVGGLGVRDAQQRLGETHQHDALARGEPEAAQECFGAERLAGAPPDLARKPERPGRDAATRRVVESDARRQRGDAFSLVGAVGTPDRLPRVRAHVLSAAFGRGFAARSRSATTRDCSQATNASTSGRPAARGVTTAK